jgi:hypothetical protein
MKRTPGRSRPSLERYEGPYRIVRVVNPVLYEAEIVGKLVRAHAVNRKPF